ncbi:unnamed protein product [Phytophthora fragariaefolia]|uniref:Unnamed protein product n=1 Tax=Phytophthora fragariaefolia TaxID=1490495 RepID=A0A9W7CVX5_9STRA|nr:unnamed protein product [Phytophthora fragariaefolia]
MVNGSSVVAPPSYVIGITEGSAAASKALVLDSMLDVSGINTLSATNLAGSLQTASQPNITSLGTLTSINTSGSLSMGGISISSSEISVLDGVSPGTAQASKALVLNSSLNISGIGSLSATSLAGTLQTTAQPNITSVGTLTSLALSGGISGVTTLLGIQYQSRATTYTDTSTTGGATVASSVILSYGQPTIASANTITITRAATIYIDNSPAQGTNTMIQNSYSLWIANGKVLIGDTSASSSTTTGASVVSGGVGIGGLTVSGGLSSATITGTIQTSSQPNITSLGTLSSLTVSGGLSSATITGTIQTSSQPNITSLGDLMNLSIRSVATVGEIAYICMPAQAAGYSSWITIGKSSSGNEGGRIGYYHDSTYANQYLYITHNNKSPIFVLSNTSCVGINILTPTYDPDLIEVSNGSKTVSTSATWLGNNSDTDLRFGTNNSTCGICLGGTNRGRWGFGTTNPSYGVHNTLTVSTTLDAAGTGVAYFLKSGDLVSTLGPLSAIPVGIGTVAAILAGSGIYTTSDARIKKDWIELNDDVCDSMLKVEPLLFWYKTDDDSVPLQIGYKAQDLLRANIPRTINFVADETMVAEGPYDADGIRYSVDYGKMVCLLHKLVIRQQKEINDLESLISGR